MNFKQFSCFSYQSRRVMKAITNKSTNLSYIQIFDIEREQAIEQLVDFKLLDNLNDCGQIMIGSALYVCGTTHKFTFDSSFFFKFDPESNPQIVNLVNCRHAHEKPSMTNLFKEFIFVIGGRKSLKCEKYKVRISKWIDMPDLPETRYGCNVISDEFTESFYLFGGYCFESQKHCSSILKFIIKQNKWETIFFKETKETKPDLLCRSFSGIIRSDRNIITILGGVTGIVDTNEDYLNTIVEVNITNKTISESSFKLHYPSKFLLQNAIEHENNLFLIDNEQIPGILKFDKIEGNVELLSFMNKNNMV